MSQTLDHKEMPQDDHTFRRVLGLRPVRTVVFDGEDFLEPCPTCGHRALADAPPELPPGEPVPEVPLDRAAIGQAHWTVAMLMEVLDQRRPAKQLTDLVAPRVLRYLRAMPVEASGLRGGARLLSFHPSQPHEGAVEVAGSVRLRGRRRALAVSFTLVGLDRWLCSTIRIL
ncbi:Rv3235 family protein [Pseudonocardia sp. RS11V-5]|uniref:Rv3235 family protein n=1 Tax=Pseudonocardia terrae TaxID=2905831 RepID=UPI001E5D3A85|nr:Rv3235 family protein [Pseudonocardia terrae]MCE3554430.1 Rv3235 family protein [Pseudonocardia terrae]